MSYALRDLLSPTNIMTAYQQVLSLNNANPMVAFFDAKPAEQVNGQTWEYMWYPDARKTAPVSRRGAPAKTMDQEGGEKRTISLLHSFNEISIPQESVEFLREDNGPTIQDRGMKEIRRQLEMFAKKNANLKKIALSKALCDGVVYFDADGLVLESSSGAGTTADLGVGATHKSQLAHASNGGSDIIGTAWDNAASSWLTDLEQIREAAEYDGVPTPKHVWMHSCAKPWLLSNTEIKAYVQPNNPQAQQYLDLYAGRGDMISIGDWTFHFTNATYIGADGTTIRPLIPKTKAIICPDINDGDWFVKAEGSETVPTKDGVVNSIDEYFSSTSVVYGDFAYARIDDNPLKLAIRGGTNFIYAFKDPNAIWMPTVDF